ncbi:hypothetical protein Lfu02_69530 [Longispora fulva]|nr:hypothetical protein Lfu02_69530 [Longispora fulva]
MREGGGRSGLAAEAAERGDVAGAGGPALQELGLVVVAAPGQEVGEADERGHVAAVGGPLVKLRAGRTRRPMTAKAQDWALPGAKDLRAAFSQAGWREAPPTVSTLVPYARTCTAGSRSDGHMPLRSWLDYSCAQGSHPPMTRPLRRIV